MPTRLYDRMTGRGQFLAMTVLLLSLVALFCVTRRLLHVETNTLLLFFNMFAWGGMGTYMAPGAWSSAFSESPRHGDPMRLGCLTTAIVIVLFNLRKLLAPDNLVFQALCYVLSIAVALFIVRLGVAYGRGPRVK